MDAGALRHRITIEELTGTRDEYGEPATTWTPFAVVWAGREDLSGREGFAAQQVKADLTTKFTMRYREGVTPLMRIISEDWLYNIASVIDADGRRRMLTIIAARQV